MSTRVASEFERIPVESARWMYLNGTGLCADPARRAGLAAVRKIIEQLGFVQVDTINIVDRAHHQILRTRLDGYEPRMLEHVTEKNRSFFEHWTHDASIIRLDWYPYWQHRFARYSRAGHSRSDWWKKRIGPNADTVVAHVLERITNDGPMMSRDFEHVRDEDEDPSWWGWKPQKAALEYLWRIGRLAVAKRINFHKVYDLIERVLGDHHEIDAPDDDAHTNWACREALERLGFATPGEIAQYLNAIKPPVAAAWCREAVKRGEIVTIEVETSIDAKPRRAFALHDWRKLLAKLNEPPDRMRLISPFDPLIRDRNRAQRLFDFDYHFEAFVPEAKRIHGYYVMPILKGDRLIGRLDPKLHRDKGVLEIKGLWWEPKVRVTRKLQNELEALLSRLASALGAVSARVNT